MSHLSFRARGRRAVVAVIATSLLSGLALAASTAPAGATADVTTDRVAGSDRFATAAAIALEAFPQGSDTAVIASGRAFPDALAGAPLGLPLLLTERTSLPASTADALDDLGATDVIILGGTAAVSTAVQDELQDMGLATDRVGGQDRYETAALIGQEIGATGVSDLDGKATAFIATGLNFADALAGGPLAAAGAGATGVHPILLTNDGVPASTESALDDLGIEQVVILGGTAAVSSAVETKLEQITGSPAVRYAGTNRFGTAVDIADAALADFDFPGDEVLLARGDNGPNNDGFADALAGGPFGAEIEAPIILTNPTQLPDESAAFFEDNFGTVDSITALGGTAAVSQAALDAAEDAAETPGDSRANETYAVTPQDDERLANGSTRTYTVNGITAATVDIVIVPCANVTTGSDASTRFANTNFDAEADRSGKGTADPNTNIDQASTGSAITSVNGTPRPSQDPTINNDYVDDAEPDGGTLTFVVSGPSGSSTSSSCVVPVVFDDADQGDSLSTETKNPALPSEDFGTGGAANFSPAGAEGGTIGSSAANGVNVDSNSDANDVFVGCFILGQPEQTGEVLDECHEYHYDSNDVFKIAGGSVNMTVFESALSPEDDVKGTYAETAAGKSTFDLVDEAPEPATDPSARTNQAQNVVIEFTESDTPGIADNEYRLMRIADPSSAADSCPAFSGSYTQVDDAAERDASTPPQNPVPSSTLTLKDTSAVQGAAYCYRVLVIDDGDPGSASTPVELVVGAAADNAPKLTGALASSADSDLSAGDVHELTFSEAMAESTAQTATYTVHSGSLPVPNKTIDCAAAEVECALSSDFKTMHVHLLSAFTTSPGTLAYPLTIDAVTNMKDRDGGTETPLDFAGSTDKSIEKGTISDTSRPTISAAVMPGDPGPDGFGDTVGDKLTLTFTEGVFPHVANTSAVTPAELRAILGRSEPTYGGQTVVTLTQTAADKLTFEVTGGPFSSGVLVPNASEQIPGSSTSNVADAAGNPEAVATSPTTLTK